MDYKEFTDILMDKVQKLAGDDVEILHETVTKNNVPNKDALLMRDKDAGITTACLFYQEHLYRSYKEGKSIDELAAYIVNTYKKRPTDIDVSFYDDFEKAKNRVFLKLINKAENEEFLKTVPYRIYLDLAIVPYYKYEDDMLGSSSITIHNALLKKWDISAQELFTYAERNTLGQEPVLKGLNELLDELSSKEGTNPDRQEEMSPYVLTNKEGYLGAVYLAYDQFLSRIADELEQDFFVLPSSIHECIIIPTNITTDGAELGKMVRSINADVLKPEDILSDHPYFYQRDLHKLSIVEEKRVA